MTNRIKKQDDQKQESLDQQFIKNYQERIIIFKKILRDVCPYARGCPNEENCPRGFGKILGYEQNYIFLSKYSDLFNELFPFEQEHYPDENYTPEQWHTEGARVVYFLLKNKNKFKVTRLAEKKFNLSSNAIYKIKHYYLTKQKDFLSMTPVKSKKQSN